MRLQISHATPQLRALDRIEDVTFRDLKHRFTADEMFALFSGRHVYTDLAVVREVRA